ncbi:alpha/beta-hydrolase [Xylariomycetidae sp. FL0641]|nr:alpha/beta-hydrolase [Xylariomycetidae sp. FL0641]
MASNKPVIMISHGAWHRPETYDPLKHALEARGYDVIVPRHVTLGEDKTGLGLHDDVANLLHFAMPIFDSGRSIVLWGHSYGCIVACAATKGNTVEDRRPQGKTGGFSHVIFACGIVTTDPTTNTLRELGGVWPPPFKVIDHKSGGKQLFVTEEAQDLLYNGLPAEQAQRTFDSLAPMSYEAFVSPTGHSVSEINVPKTYMICEADALVPTMIQKKYADGCGPELKQVTVSGGHSAFASVPDEVADVMVGLIGVDLEQ